jgi:predicted acylesterase/phospholipase RssA
LSEFLGNENGLLTGFAGKVGLALSGGGFRASLFHIGVLAKLAELDLLRHVEVISCVSGGSILGAYYYLELQQLLQQKPDVNISQPEKAIRQEDYIEILKRIQKNFIQGVQSNIRTRVLANPLVNLRMIFSASYSRTEYVGELYESKLFSRIKYGKSGRPHYLNDLKVNPIKSDGQLEKDFNPKERNWKRQAKVPILILNATTLNTGHNWQFTASWMGEPPSYIDTEIDSNYRLRRMYYRQAPHESTDYQNVPIGRAVAASSCVPGLFEPIVFPYLYPGKTVRLVDGGVQDNQGVTGLLEQGCTVLLVSDASGQMEALNEPKSNAFGVLVRTNGILMSRVREAQFQELDSRRRSSLLRGLMFVHLKKDLGDRPVDWIGSDEPYTVLYDVRPAAEVSVQTSYGISKKVQNCLAAIRTDLDSFSEAEAFALMTSGYLMTEQEFREGKIKGFPGPTEQEFKDRPDWEFLKIREVMEVSHPTDHENISRAKLELIKQLTAGALRGFKIWKLKLGLRYAALALIVLLAFVACSLIYGLWSLFTFRVLVVILGTIVVGLLIRKLMGRIVRLGDLALRVIIGISVGSIGWFAALIHLWTFDKWFKWNGRLGFILPVRSASLPDNITTEGSVETPADEKPTTSSERSLK